MTLPSALFTPAIAREAAELVLDVHRLGPLVRPALLIVRELTSVACQFTPAGQDIHLHLRHAHGVLRITVFDTHAEHAHRLIAAACDDLRHARLTDTPRLTDAHHGTWGTAPAYHPATGTRTWATLPDPN
jgi:hypothetical protein